MLLPFGEENILSYFELKQIATRMVIQYGWGPVDSPVVYHRGRAIYSIETLMMGFKVKVKPIQDMWS
ncbi:hypothetical protein L1987_01546 [Smallanthus sonchifolius]|uniref:Uncharacterized protein n=1 Tax=Smallanthus sonchifolius TaxID=185202 RepID=A0ACB9K5I4_9ASTR|nr:hypothetical protein L1987_01546 [Smallanthus sonchifolius]